MDYQLTITFSELGRQADLPDRLLTVLLKRLADAGPALAHNRVTGELTVAFAFSSSDPIDEVSRLSKALGEAMFDLGLGEAPTIVDAHLAAAEEDGEQVGIAEMLSSA